MLSTQMTLWEAFRQVAEDRREQEALVCEGQRFTYRGLLTQVDALAAGLSDLGVRKGDRLVCMLPPGLDFVDLFFAIAKLGAVIIPLNPQTRLRALHGVLENARPVALIASRPLERSDFEGLDDLRLLIQDGGGGSSLADIRAAGKGLQTHPAEVSPGDLLALLYTSGTTGAPKGTMHTHRTLIAPVVASLRLRDLWIGKPDIKWLGRSVKALARYRLRLLRAAGHPQTFLSTAGWHSVTGLEVMLQALLMGDRLVVMPRFNPREALQLIEKEGVSILVAIPIGLQIMLEIAKKESFDTSSLLICGTGSAPCPPELAQEIREQFGCAVHIGFGATETGGGISATSLEDSEQNQMITVGRPMPGMEIKVVDDRRHELPPGQVGELTCRSDSIMLGYYQAPEATAEVLDGEGWYYTGDLAFVDEDGYIRIVGRKKDMIIRGGQNVYPVELEAFLAFHPKIHEAVVLGMPAQVGGEAVWAVLILKEGQDMTVQEVLEYCREALEPYKIPSQVRFVESFPRSDTGKPQKFKLRERFLGETQL